MPPTPAAAQEQPHNNGLTSGCGAAVLHGPVDVETGATSPEGIRCAPMTGGIPLGHLERGMWLMRDTGTAFSDGTPARRQRDRLVTSQTLKEALYEGSQPCILR